MGLGERGEAALEVAVVEQVLRLAERVLEVADELACLALELLGLVVLGQLEDVLGRGVDRLLRALVVVDKPGLGVGGRGVVGGAGGADLLASLADRDEEVLELAVAELMLGGVDAGADLISIT